jgi:hypothetical protein
LPRIAAAHGDQAAVDQALVWTDYTLRRIPLEVGESRSRLTERVWYGDILGVAYVVDDQAMTVRVVSVGPARRR